MAYKQRKPIPFEKAKDAAHVSNTLPISPCQRLMDSLNSLQEIQERVDYYLPENLRGHCRIGSISHGVLSLVTSNASWATRLRGVCLDLRFALQRHEPFSDIHKIIVRVKPEQATPPKHKRKLPDIKPPSASSKLIIADTADSVANPHLKAALRRLAKR